MSTAKKKQNESTNVDTTPPEPTPVITDQDIAERAYAIYMARGGEDGHDVEDWLQAERELRQQQDPAA